LCLKICNFAEESNGAKIVARRSRFDREINAMKLALEQGKGNLVVNIVKDGIIELAESHSRFPNQHEQPLPKKHFKCFLMELADCTLDTYLDKNLEITLQQRLLLCSGLLQSIAALHDIGIYHRDIKPENIFCFGNTWKIGDLGLVEFRGSDAEIDTREKIGPPKWMSPEAFNKAYCLLRPDSEFIDRTLDDRSDVYQLGKLCWHVLQGDIPNGCLKSKDLVIAGDDVYGTFLKPMLRYRQAERPLLRDIGIALSPILRKHSL
jgi:serine/threonine protein kinase